MVAWQNTAPRLASPFGAKDPWAGETCPSMIPGSPPDFLAFLCDQGHYSIVGCRRGQTRRLPHRCPSAAVIIAPHLLVPLRSFGDLARCTALVPCQHVSFTHLFLFPTQSCTLLTYFFFPRPHARGDCLPARAPYRVKRPLSTARSHFLFFFLIIFSHPLHSSTPPDPVAGRATP